MTSEVSLRARAFVSAHEAQARGLGEALGDMIDDPEAFAETLEEGLEALSDPLYEAEQERVAPGSGQVIGVRWALWHVVARAVRAQLKGSSSSSAISLAQRLAGSPVREIRLFATVPLRQSVDRDPERSWQVIRRLARAANDWISVDSMADLVAHGILAEPFRWAELELLVYSAHPWERRLVGSTIARLPFAVPTSQRTSLRGVPALDALGLLIGDADPNVQKALSWALREWTRVDSAGVGAFLQKETELAAAVGDGHRAWVVRDAMLPHGRAFQEELRTQLGQVRKRPGMPSTSRASEIAASFAGALEASDGAIAQQGERMAAAGGGTYSVTGAGAGRGA